MASSKPFEVSFQFPVEQLSTLYETIFTLHSNLERRLNGHGDRVASFGSELIPVKGAYMIRVCSACEYKYQFDN